MNTSRNEIIKLFENDDDKIEIQSLLNIDIDNLELGMSEFQINNFVLNKKENTNDLFLYKQVKLELYTRINSLFDFLYQYKKANAEIMLAKGEIIELQGSNMNSIKKDAKVKLQEIEIERLTYQLFNIKKQAIDKLRECKVFASHYDALKYLNNLPVEQLQEMEDEGWRIKSAYFSELIERYNLTPRGYMPLPHEEGGLEGLIQQLYKKKLLQEEQLKNDNNQNKQPQVEVT